jgi:hypothetical protein
MVPEAGFPAESWVPHLRVVPFGAKVVRNTLHLYADPMFASVFAMPGAPMLAILPLVKSRFCCCFCS